MILDLITIYEEVVEVVVDGCVDLVAKDGSAQPLECCEGITVPLLHYFTLKCFKCHYKGSLLDV